MAKTNQNGALPGGLKLSRAFRSFYFDNRPPAGAPELDRTNNIHLSQERFFSARLRTATLPPQDWKPLLTARPRQTARSKPPLLS